MSAADQLELTYRPRFVGQQQWVNHLEAIRAAVDHLTRKEVCYELGCKDTYLAAALRPPSPEDDDERKDEQRKYWRAPWTLIVLAMLNAQYSEVADEHAAKILGTQARLTRFTVDERVTLSDTEILAKMARDPKRKAEIDALRKGRT